MIVSTTKRSHDKPVDSDDIVNLKVHCLVFIKVLLRNKPPIKRMCSLHF